MKNWYKLINLKYYKTFKNFSRDINYKKKYFKINKNIKKDLCVFNKNLIKNNIEEIIKFEIKNKEQMKFILSNFKSIKFLIENFSDDTI